MVYSSFNFIYHFSICDLRNTAILHHIDRVKIDFVFVDNIVMFYEDRLFVKLVQRL